MLTLELEECTPVLCSVPTLTPNVFTFECLPNLPQPVKLRLKRVPLEPSYPCHLLQLLSWVLWPLIMCRIKIALVSFSALEKEGW